MENENFTIEIEGKEVNEIYQDLINLEIELDDDLAGMFRLQIAISKQTDGLWTYLDDERFMVWKQVTITGGFDSGVEEIISGYITHVKPIFTSDSSQCTLEIWGMDGSVLMDRQEKLKDWPNKKDSDIASEIFSSYGFTPDVEDTEIIHDETISTIIQRETDMQFLRRIALRNGYECYVQGTRGFFNSPELNKEPQTILAIHFGEETNVINFSLEVNALMPANVSMVQVDRTNKEILDSTVESSMQYALGSTDSISILPTGIEQGQVHIGMNAATGNPEMAKLCQGLYHQAEWFVTGKGEISGNSLGIVLMPRGMVTVKGMGETHSGIYYVTHVTHSFKSDGYTQLFKVKRNAIMPTGSESFSPTLGLF